MEAGPCSLAQSAGHPRIASWKMLTFAPLRLCYRSIACVPQLSCFVLTRYAKVFDLAIPQSLHLSLEHLIVFGSA